MPGCSRHMVRDAYLRYRGSRMPPANASTVRRVSSLGVSPDHRAHPEPAPHSEPVVKLRNKLRRSLSGHGAARPYAP